MTKSKDFLVEVGTEELPPKALHGLMTAFAEALTDLFARQRLTHGEVHAYASPRRLAVVVDSLAEHQATQELELKGPPVSVAFDDAGEPRPAAEAFAKKCGVTVADLERSATDKGEWLTFRKVEQGNPAADLIAQIVSEALERLPIPRPMRWGDSPTSFVRPVHWVVLLHGRDAIEAKILGVEAGQQSYGHRFHAPQALEIELPAEYVERLEQAGHVIVDFAARQQRIEEYVHAAATERGGRAVALASLYEEVAALTEWPVPVAGSFDPAYLELPREVIVATLTGHQRYFPIENADGDLLPAFITIANIDSLKPELVREGNERVVQPRLADAAFFWKTDREVPLTTRREQLDQVIYQKGLGTVGDRSERLAKLAASIANRLGEPSDVAGRAGELAKCDLVTGMVGEFPELQGTMGRYYALAAGESEAIAAALEEQYQPRFAGDAIPASAIGRCLSLADKLDALCGGFALGKKPSGNRDPFGLRRSALGIVRICVEAELDLNLAELIATGMALQPVDCEAQVANEVYDFIVERMRGYAAERLNAGAELFDAVRAGQPESLSDFAERLRAVRAFISMDAAASLAAANKRIGNILRKAEHTDDVSPNRDLLTDTAEIALFDALHAAQDDVAPLLSARDYAGVMSRLARLRQPVDAFFDDVMVMADDDAVRHNRLTLLAALRAQFLNVADVSRLAIQ